MIHRILFGEKAHAVIHRLQAHAPYNSLQLRSDLKSLGGQRTCHCCLAFAGHCSKMPRHCRSALELCGFSD
eukprot:1933152-Amphidinium_carterae.1